MGRTQAEKPRSELVANLHEPTARSSRSGGLFENGRVSARFTLSPVDACQGLASQGMRCNGDPMQRIWYANSWFSTDDEVADALMEYATVLALLNSSDVVVLPALDTEGARRQVRMIVGPASQILAMNSDDADFDFHSHEMVEDLRRRSRHRLPDAVEIAAALSAAAAE